MTVTSCYVFEHILPRYLDWLTNFWTIKLYNSKAFGRHSSLWTKATTFNRSQRGYSWPEAATVCCGHRPQNLRVYKESIWGRRPPQFVVAKGHNIWKVTLDRKPRLGTLQWPLIIHLVLSLGHNKLLVLIIITLRPHWTVAHIVNQSLPLINSVMAQNNRVLLHEA